MATWTSSVEFFVEYQIWPFELVEPAAAVALVLAELPPDEQAAVVIVRMAMAAMAAIFLRIEMPLFFIEVLCCKDGPTHRPRRSIIGPDRHTRVHVRRVVRGVLDGGKAAVNNEVGPGGVRGGVREQVDNRSGELLRRAHPLERNHLGPDLAPVLADVSGHLGLDVARTNRVDADTQRGPLDSE